MFLIYDFVENLSEVGGRGQNIVLPDPKVLQSLGINPAFGNKRTFSMQMPLEVLRTVQKDTESVESHRLDA